MKTHQNTTLHCLWAIGCCLLLAGPSFAAKPQPKPPPEPPPEPPPVETAAYQYIELGSPGARGAEVLKVNASGVVLGRYGTGLINADGMEINGLFVVVPVLNSSGLPVWFVDDGSGKNQLMTVLGLPEVLEEPAGFNIQADINDHGQVVLNVGKELFVLQPQFNHTTQSWSYVPEGFNGTNPWMTKVILSAGGVYEYIDTPSINNRGQIFGVRSWDEYLGDLTGVGTDDPFNYVSIDRGFLIRGMDTDANQIADSWNLIDPEGGNLLEEHLWSQPDKDGVMIPVHPFRSNHDGWVAGNSSWTSPCLLKPRWVGDSLAYWIDANNDNINDLVIPLCPGNYGGVRDINAKGKIVGYQYISSSSFDSNAMVWEVASTGTVNATVFKKTKTTAYWFQAINDQDVIVGRQTVTSRTGSLTSAIVVTGTTTDSIKDLRSLTDRAAALSGLNMRAVDINNSGHIVGITTYNTGPRPFIAVPKSNP